MTLQGRLVTVLDEILPIQEEEDGAVTVHHNETFASLRVVTIAEGLDMVSLTQIIAWDLPLDSKIRAKVAKSAHDTLRTDTGESVYRLCSAHHHHHLVCRACGSTVEVQGRQA